jgi:ubiquinone biosynthesis protein COQ4
MSHVQFQPARALQAARKLFADPDDLPQVFTIVDSLSGDTLARTVKRMYAHESGRRLLEKQPDIVALLSDREALARLPEGSLGRAYLAFVERENISPEGIREANAKGANARELPPPLDWMFGRMRDTHDLWHPATGYSGDVLGETALLAFIFAQTWNPAIGFILLLGLAKTFRTVHGGEMARRTIFDGFRRGRQAGWLPAVEWERLLALPLQSVREQLWLAKPPVYTEVRSWQLKSARARRDEPHAAAQV